MRSFSWVWLVLVCCLLAGTSAFPAAGGKEDKKPDVVINIVGTDENGMYIKEGDKEQKPVEVFVGQTVRWNNQGNVTHTASSEAKKDDKRFFDTGNIKPKASKDIVFDQQLYQLAGGAAGGQKELKYSCRIHPSMKSSIILKDKSQEKRN